MNTERYPVEALEDGYDDGTMPENVTALSQAVVGRRIRTVEQREVEGSFWGRDTKLVLTLDNGTEVQLVNTGDCCAYTTLKGFWENPDLVNHVITGVGTTDEYTTWHIYADLGDVMHLNVDWSGGNIPYYGYGFEIRVEPVTIVVDAPEKRRVPRELEGGAS